MIHITVTSGQEHDRMVMADILARQDDFRIACLGADGYDALMSAKTQHPDIIIMDYCMQDITCTDLAPVIKRSSPSTALIALCTGNEHCIAGKVLQAGVSGCLSRQDDFTILPSTVRCVYHGGLYLSQPISNQILHIAEDAVCPDNHITDTLFTSTELRIFYGISLGYTDKEIAQSLNINIGSLRNIITRVKEKTRLKNRTQMTIFALSVAMMNRGSIKGQLTDVS